MAVSQSERADVEHAVYTTVIQELRRAGFEVDDENES